MILSNLIAPLTTTIIAPHGITDYIHAKKYDLLDPLYKIQAGSTIGTLMLHYSDHPYLLNGIFIAFAAAHFRHDMPQIKDIPRYYFSSSFITLSLLLNPSVFYWYMITIHVPHHYQMNWKLLKDKPKFSKQIIIGFSLICSIFTPVYDDIISNDLLCDIGKALVISHILYEEMFII